MGIVFKINLILLAVVVFLGSLMGALFIESQKQHLSEELDRRINLIGGYLSQSIEPAISSGDLATVDLHLQAAGLDKEIAYVMVKSAEGEIQAARWENRTTGNVSEYSFPLRLAEKNREKTGARFGAISSNTSKIIGELTVGVDLTLQNAAIRRLLWATITSIITAAILSMVVGLICVRMLLHKSVLPLVEGMRRIGAGEIDYRFSIETRDEISEIGKRFNEMADRLFETLVSKQGLEAIVEERTSELKVALEERIRLTEQLIQAQKMESIGRLAGGVAHDFNNLLTPITGYADLLKRDLPPESPGAVKVGLILKAAERAKELVKQLLSFGRKQILEMKSLDLNQVINSIYPMLRRTIRENIDIRLSLVQGVYSISADANQIDQIIMNLLVNAQDAIPGKGVITIETAPVILDDEYAAMHSGVTPGRYMMMAITDNGVGMNYETRQRIFEPFFTTKGVGKGTGLGLATVYGIVCQHGGNIWVYSEPDNGTTFRIYFPLIDAEPQPEGSISPMQSVLAGRNRCIMVVEDNEMVMELVCEMLIRNDFEVITAECPEDALRKSEGRHIDLLVADVVMPDLTGPELYAKLVSKTPDLKVLYMSGYTNNAIVHHGVLDEGVNYIQKPFAMAEFAEKINYILAS
jgi:signal transduction histidine kinase/CheY-like chemotaxis protein